MDLLTKTAVWSEVASDFHIEPEGEGSMFSYNVSNFCHWNMIQSVNVASHENLKPYLASLH
jgi:hypothetical protein